MGTSWAVHPVQITKAAPHLWPTAPSPWLWTPDSQIPHQAGSLFLASEPLSPHVKSVSQLCTVHTSF